MCKSELNKACFKWQTIALVVAVLLGYATTAAAQRDIAGTWLSSNGSDVHYLSLNSDGSFEYGISSYAGQSYFSGTWQLIDSQIIFTPTQTGQAEQYPIRIANPNVIVISFSGGPVTFQRRGQPNIGGGNTPRGGLSGGSGGQAGADFSDKDLTDLMVGSWQFNGTGVAMLMTVAPDHSFTLYIKEADGRNQKFSGALRVEGNQLILTSDDGVSESHPISFQNNNVWTGTFQNLPVTFIRKAGGPAPATGGSGRLGSAIGSVLDRPDNQNQGQTPATVDISGVWTFRSQQGSVRAEFQKDGRYSVTIAQSNGATQIETGTYTISGDEIAFTSNADGSVDRAQFSLKGNSLTIQTPQFTMNLQRVQ